MYKSKRQLLYLKTLCLKSIQSNKRCNNKNTIEAQRKNYGFLNKEIYKIVLKYHII